MFQMIHCHDMPNLETKTDDIELTANPRSHSGGDYASDKSISNLHYGESKTSCLSRSKSTDIEQDENENDDTGKRTSSVLSVSSTNDKNPCRKVSAELKVQLSRYKQELREYSDTTQHLEQKYRRINTELNEMQMKHNEFLALRKSNSSKSQASLKSFLESSSRTSSAYSLNKKYAKDVDTSGDSRSILTGANKVRTRAATSLNLRNRNNYEISKETHLNAAQTTGLKNIYKVLKTIMENQEIQQQKLRKSNKQFITDENNLKSIDVLQLQSMLSKLQAVQSKSNKLIEEQEKCLHEYRRRCMEAHQIVQLQKHEIKNLQNNNTKLESEFDTSIEHLRIKIDMKLREVSMLPKLIREERDKNIKYSLENKSMVDRLRIMQQEAQQLHIKLEEVSRRKTAVIGRLRAAERDLKIFKNHNMVLKNEKKLLMVELKKAKDQLGAAQATNQRSFSRQREQFEKQRRALQKRIYELKVKLKRSETSTTSIIQERDKVIAELQSQLNTFVHNFEISQKHIHVLRRHIYSTPNSSQNMSATTAANPRFNRV